MRETMLITVLLISLVTMVIVSSVLAAYLYGENRNLKLIVADAALREITIQAEARDTLERLFEKANIPTPYRGTKPDTAVSGSRRFVSPSQFNTELQQKNEGREAPRDPAPAVIKAQRVPSSVKTEFLRETESTTV